MSPRLKRRRVAAVQGARWRGQFEAARALIDPWSAASKSLESVALETLAPSIPVGAWGHRGRKYTRA